MRILNPCQYVASALQGFGLRDRDLVKAFAKFLREKILFRTLELEKHDDIHEWPMSLNKLIKSFDDGPIQYLYNTIYLTLYPNCKYNSKGYAETESKNIANKIWSIASDWTALITGKKSSKQVMLGLTVHRLSASKEISNILNKYGHAISYNDIRLQNEHWARTSFTSNNIYNDLEKNTSTHSSLDNNDFRTETHTGHGTAHHTNQLLFQPQLKGKFL